MVLEHICGLNNARGKWYRGNNVAPAWTRHNMIGEAIRPNHLWIDNSGGILPVFIDSARRLGIGHGKRPISRTLQWLRKTDHHLAVVTNGRQWRILIIMRMVVVLFAESREELLPTDHPVYQSAYSIGGLREQLSRISGHRLENSYYAYPRLLALFRLIYQGSSQEAFPVQSGDY